jgi:hypothetical protein
MILQSLCLLQIGELFDELFLTVSGKADGEFDVVSRAFTAKN